MILKLSKRLQSIISEIPLDVKVADIGSDHAYIPIALALRGNKKSIATEVSIGPYKQCVAQISKFNVSVDVRLGSGLAPLKEKEVEYVIIAGMSGTTIKRIIVEAGEKAKTYPKFIFQPMLDVDKLRFFLLDNKFGIEKEWVVEDSGKFYQFIQVIPKKIGIPSSLSKEYPNIDMDYLIKLGPKLLLNKEGINHEFFNMKLNKLYQIKKQVEKGNNISRLKTIEAEISQLEKVVRCHLQYSKLPNY